MPDAAHSGQLPRDWGAVLTEEERAHLQNRLATFCAALFASFLALVGLMFVMYAVNPEPRYQHIIYGAATLALAILAVLWRGLLVRGQRAPRTLYRIDLVIMIGSGFTFGAVAVLAYDLEAAAYTCLLYESFVVFTRALLIPCTRLRTLVVSSLAFAPIVAGSIVLAWLDHRYIADLEIGGVMFVVGNLVYNGVAVLLATQGTRIIYDLRAEVKKAKKAGRIQLQLGQYTIGEQIGGGGMGEVFRATHALLRRETAVKLMLPDKMNVDAYDWFETEVRAMSRLTHPNTVAVFDYGRSLEGRLYYAMEYLEGVDLQRLVKASGPLPAGRVIQILQQVCGALHEAHTKDIIHRDIKPANIILCAERGGVPDVAKVVDFGLVQIASDPAKTRGFGTVAYMAPECLLPKTPVTASADLYAVGAVGYYLLTGELVFTGKLDEIMVAHATKAPTPPSQRTSDPIPAELEALILKCLAKQPEDRFPTAAAMATALGAIQTSDWDAERATEWWADWKKAKRSAKPPPSHDARTVTLAVALDARLPDQPGLTGHEK